MKITPTLTAVVETTKQDMAQVLKQLQPGQQLQARVLATPKETVARLQIGLTELFAKTDIKLQSGQRLNLEVIKLQPIPELLIKDIPNKDNQIQQVLRAVLAKQIPIQQVMTELEQLPEAKDASSRTLLRTIEQIIKAQAIQTQRIETNQLRSQLANSGLFLERHLAKGEIPHTDKKLDLLKILNQLSELSRSQQQRAQTTTSRMPVSQTQALETAARTEANQVLAKILKAVIQPGTGASTRQGMRQLIQSAYRTDPHQGHQQKMQAGSETSRLMESTFTSVLSQIKTMPAGNQGYSLITSALNKIIGLVQQASPQTDARQLIESALKTLILQNQSGPVPMASGTSNQLLERLLQFIRQQSQGTQTQEPETAPGQARAPIDSGMIERLMRLVEGSIARIQTQQAASLPQEDGNRQAWQFELPVNHQGRLEHLIVRFEREQNRGVETMDRAWSVTLTFEFEHLGKIQAQIQLQGETVSTRFSCDNDSTDSLVKGNLGELATALDRAGLNVTRLQSRHDRNLNAGSGIQGIDGILDEQA